MLLLKLIKLIWASPYTLLGLLIGLAGLATGGGVQVRRRAIEFHGGVVTWLLGRAPILGGAAALTLGRTILGQSPGWLDACRDHEHVHIRQFERWGPLTGPAYLGCSAWLWLRGCPDPYRQNPFEREAFDAEVEPCQMSAPHGPA